MKYILTLLVGLLGFVALWAAWQLALWLLTPMCAGLRAYIGCLLAIASAFLALVAIEVPKGWRAEQRRKSGRVILEEKQLDELNAAMNLYTPKPGECICWKCLNGKNYAGMVLCSTCGNKRCPKASDHELACTGSNEPGQLGSVYTEVPHADSEPT